MCGGKVKRPIATPHCDQHYPEKVETPTHEISIKDPYLANKLGIRITCPANHGVFCFHYHGMEPCDIAPGFKITATSENEKVAEAFQHKYLPIYGYQFHPEALESTFAIIEKHASS